uniref:Uncharacterized protein n=1 Tax=Amphimedon queenslandica TaxID=400682 RepID=A0A1X7V568_AMPQE
MLRRKFDMTVGLVNGAIGEGLSLDTAIIDLLIDVFGDGMAYHFALFCLRTLQGLYLISFDPLSVKKTKGKNRKIQVTGIIYDSEPCSKNAKVSVSHVQSSSNSTVSSNKRKSTDLQKSNCPKKSKICDNNALNKPCPHKRKVDVDCSTDNTALVLPCSKKDVLIVSINLEDQKFI